MASQYDTKMAPIKVTTQETPSGLQFQVGRNAQSNAALANNADRDDYWLHAEGPGAHAVLDGSGSEADVMHVAKYLGGGRVTVARCCDVKVTTRGLATVAKCWFIQCK